MTTVSWNPNDKADNIGLLDDLTVDIFAQTQGIRATEGKTSGKWYWEITHTQTFNNNLKIGVSTKEFNVNGGYAEWNSNIAYINIETSRPTGDVYGLYLNIDESYLEVHRNGVKLEKMMFDSSLIGKEVFPHIGMSLRTGANKATANFGATPFQYEIPEGYLPYNFFPQNKILILSDSSCKKWDGSWQIVTASTPTKQDYIDNGMEVSNIGAIPESAWAELQGEFKLLYYTDDPEVFSANIQTTHELNLLQDDLLQADKIQLLNWFENEEDVNLQVFGELNNKFTSINKVINHEQVSKIVADSIGNAKFLVSEDKITWKRWNTVEWETVTINHKDEIATLGMSKNALKDITKAQWEQLGHEFYLGTYLDKQTEIKNINYQSGIPNLTPEVSNASLYILNTTATLDITLQGNKLYGAVTDDDKGKVQYRIILNGDPYLPDDGTFTPLEPEPQNINLRIPSDKINIGGNNTIRIEFQDAWGSLDYWQTSFIGELNGLLFFDEQGELYSDELGEVIKPLDFGTIITGQMSLEHKIIFKNTLGQPVKDVKFFSDWGEYSPIAGIGYRFSLSDSPFAGYEVLELERPVDHEEEVEIFVKMSTILGTTPETLGKVKFCVKATEIDDDEYQEILNNLS